MYDCFRSLDKSFVDTILFFSIGYYKQVTCWGALVVSDKDEVFQITNFKPQTPEKISILCGKKVKTVTVNDDRMYALTSNGELYVWKYLILDAYRLPHYREISPIKITGINPISDFKVGESHVIALTENGDLYNIDLEYNIGDGAFYQRNAIKIYKVEGLIKDKKILQIAAGAHHSLVLVEDDGNYYIK